METWILIHTMITTHPMTMRGIELQYNHNSDYPQRSPIHISSLSNKQSYHSILRLVCCFCVPPRNVLAEEYRKKKINKKFASHRKDHGILRISHDAFNAKSVCTLPVHRSAWSPGQKLVKNNESHAIIVPMPVPVLSSIAKYTANSLVLKSRSSSSIRLPPRASCRSPWEMVLLPPWGGRIPLEECWLSL